MEDDRRIILEWDIDSIAAALKISKEDVIEYFNDGRRVSFLIERRIIQQNEFLGSVLAETEGKGYDIIDREGGKWEVRSITKGGIYFCPSYMVGSGRSFDEGGFLSKLESEDFKGYIVADVVRFPRVPVWIISKAVVRNWWESGELGSTTKISRRKALALLESL